MTYTYEKDVQHYFGKNIIYVSVFLKTTTKSPILPSYSVYNSNHLFHLAIIWNVLIKRSYLENFILVWFHYNDDYIEGHTTVLQSFTDVDICVRFIMQTLEEKLFLLLLLPLSIGQVYLQRVI